MVNEPGGGGKRETASGDPSRGLRRFAQGTAAALRLRMGRLCEGLFRMTDTPRFLPAHALAAVPRYTSYPPANRFGAMEGKDQAGLIAALPENASLSLYVHIPFCESLCWYCGCNTSVPNKPERVSRYLAALELEIARIGAAMPRGARVTHIHFGGGSPDYLEPDQMRTLFAGLRGAFRFDPEAEIACELDPRGVSTERLAPLVENGLTRASLGVQDIDESIQVKINRLQPDHVVREAVEQLRAAGVAGINLDLMYGLPGQTERHVRRTADFAARLEPDRLAVFGYAHVPWFKRHQKAIREAELPGAEARFRQAETAARVLGRHGYQRIGFDHYAWPDDKLSRAAREGWLSRNFQGYVADPADAVIGLGASSISSYPGGYVQNDPVAALYADKIEKSLSPVVRGLPLTPSDRAVARQIERLMCDLALDLPADDPAWEGLTPLVADGLARIENGRLVVNEAGRPYLRNLAATLDPGFEAGPQRHSQAV